MVHQHGRLFTVLYFCVRLSIVAWMRCQIYLGVGGQFGRKREKITSALSPDTHPLARYETAARTGKHYILTIIYENTGDCEQSTNMAAALLLWYNTRVASSYVYLLEQN